MASNLHKNKGLSHCQERYGGWERRILAYPGKVISMKKRLVLFGIGFSLALAAGAQTSSQTQTPPVSSTTPANQIGSGAQNKAGTPATTSPASPTDQVNPAGTAQSSGQSQPAPATGGVAGAASDSATQPVSPEASAAGIASPSDPELESQIQNALNKEPTLTGNTTRVTVSADTIELAGNVSTSKEKITATRIVQSYAGSKKVMNHLVIGGKGSPSTQQERPYATNPGNTTNPAANPEPNKGSKPPLS